MPESYPRKSGSERESVKVRDLRGFLESEVSSLGHWSTAAFAENGRNPRLRYGNDAPGDPLRLPTGSSRPLPPALGNPHTTRVPTFPQQRRLRGPFQR